MAICNYGGNICIRFDVVDQRRHSPEPFFRRIRRSGFRPSPTSLNRPKECCLLPAHKSAGTDPQVDSKIELGIEDLIAQQSHAFGLLDRKFQALNCEWIFRTYVDKSLIRTDCITGDRHALEDSVWVSFKDTSVHERTRIP